MSESFVKYVLFLQMYQAMRDKGYDVFIATGLPSETGFLNEGQVFMCFTLRPYDGVNLSMYLK